MTTVAMRTAPRSALVVDVTLALTLAIAAGLVYSRLALLLAETSFSDFINLAFDFDPAYYVRSQAGPPATDGMGINHKHPLWMIFRIFAWPFTLAGLEPKAVAALSASLIGAISAMLVYAVVRGTGARRAESFLASVFYAASATPLVVGMIPESYGWAGLTLLALWFAYQRSLSRPSLGRPSQRLWVRAAVAVAVTGTTLTNAVQALIAEAVDGWRGRTGMAEALRARWLPFCALVTLGVLGTLALNQPADTWNMITDPLGTARSILWNATHGPKEGLAAVLETFLVFSFFAPGYTEVPLSPLVPMVDFRAWLYPSWMLATIAVWGLFALINVAVAWHLGTQRPWLLALTAALVFNVLFHLGFQYRGSLFLYGAHTHALVFLLAVSAAPHAGRQGGVARVGYLLTLAALTTAAVVNNLPRATELVQRMQHLPDVSLIAADPVYKALPPTLPSAH